MNTGNVHVHYHSIRVSFFQGMSQDFTVYLNRIGEGQLMRPMVSFCGSPTYELRPECYCVSRHALTVPSLHCIIFCISRTGTL